MGVFEAVFVILAVIVVVGWAIKAQGRIDIDQPAAVPVRRDKRDG